MLALTENAADALREILSAPSAEQSTGVRITTTVGSVGGTDFQLALAGGPEEADQVVGEEDAPVYLSPEAAPLLEDQQLDALMTDQGVSFRLSRQEMTEP
jgi:iron-sulfur cluster assembly protein